MILHHYYSTDDDKILFTRQQASDFAKQIADDFNPIHDLKAKRFCVPGDLLFALILSKYGLSQHMHFLFSGMVSDGVALHFRDVDDTCIDIVDDKNKTYLTVQRHGDTTDDADLIQQLTQSYVKFSGQTFPHLLVPLMQNNGVMIHPQRPFVVYESMEINLNQLPLMKPELELTNTHMDVVGKRGNVCLEFSLKSDNIVIGNGKKNLVLSGLRAIDPSEIKQLIEVYNQRKLTFQK